MANKNENFWQEMMERISLSSEKEFSKKEFLSDTCRFFGITHAFIFEANNKQIYEKTVYYTTPYATAIQDTLDLRNILNLEQLSELSSKKIVVTTGDKAKSQLEEILTSIFKANTLILIPILNQHYELAGFVGLADRRKEVREEDKVNVELSAAVLSLIANNIKLEMFTKGIKNTEKVLSNVLDNLGIDIYVNDYYTHDVLYLNKSMAAPYGGVENVIGKKCWQALYTDKTGPCSYCPQPLLLDEYQQPTKPYSWDYQRQLDGEWFHVKNSTIPWTDGRVAHLVSSLNITESKLNQLLIEKLAQYDHLTGLPNRRSLQDDIDNFIKDTSAFGKSFFVLFCDLDGFKKVNDTLGHHSGDALLRYIAEELKAIDEDILRAYRHGGDEFVVLLKNQASIEMLQQILDKLIEIFSKEYSFEGNTMSCGCSIGVSTFPDCGKTQKELIHVADTAMYSAKNTKKGSVHFNFRDKIVTREEYFFIQAHC